MTKLFNKGGDGAGEIVRVLGLIDNDLDFTKWEPILPLGIRDLQAIIGTEPIDAVDKYYREDHADGTEPDGMAETFRGPLTPPTRLRLHKPGSGYSLHP